MMGRQRRDEGKLFYEFRLEDRIPENHLLRRINVLVTTVLADLHKGLESFYSDDPELMILMLVVGYCWAGFSPPCKNTPIPGLPEVPGAVDPKTTTCPTPPRPVLWCKSSDGTAANRLLSFCEPQGTGRTMPFLLKAEPKGSD
jgi:hypothetical protein